MKEQSSISLPGKIERLYHSSLLVKVFLCFTLLFLFAIFYFCVFYFTTGRDTLESWYYALNSCFYNRETWANNFFNAKVKDKGNILALIGACTSASLFLYFAFGWKRMISRSKSAKNKSFNTDGWGWYGAIVALALASGIFSWVSMRPSYDEIFSAVNCTQLHPFQTISYYMLPNNHMYFNFLNNVIFGWWHDAVQSGRVISLIAYIGTLLCAWQWLTTLISKKPYAFLALLPIAFQFTVWAMAAQARGYSVELCCGWASFISMFYYIQLSENKFLRSNAFFTIIGFAVVPAYLTIYLTQGVVFLTLMVYKRKINWHYIKYQLMAGAFIFLLYLPAFCFSGVAAFTENGYVKPAFDTVDAFLPDFKDATRYFINFCFSMICGEDRAINFVLFALPVILFISKQKRDKLIAFFYTLLWLIYIAATLYFRRNPFNRNMIIHYSFTMACVVYTLYTIVSWGINIVKKEKIGQYMMYLLFALPVLSYTVYLAWCNKRDVTFSLYYNDVNAINKKLLQEVAFVPKNATVGCSYEASYFYYYFSKYGYRTTKCTNGTEEYYVKNKDEQIPQPLTGQYIKVRDCAENFEIYKRK